MKMKTPRCGNPDKVEKNILSRTKRDVIQGNILFKKLTYLNTSLVKILRFGF